MGAIEHEGYIFEIEYSVLLQKGALHVYRDGELIEEIEFAFCGEKPDEQQIEELVSEYVEQKTSGRC
ncbi:YbxH family protein [Geobacillus sp. FSL K6-0789]|uniref:YbxH family protein n=1 Tax=Geobacillus stearothermophilus TaxID=1422 RepID=A0A0K9HGC5_GEOSE|nr:YbxH family protein [Geobacillus stearothermophilus]KMY57936.1 hypothetical protein AA905_14115 [Geobacillus stearothermophilus]KMY58018.1 hypothetical protein AA904_12935 [Geobacillus stearothermophilus]KMY58759.1 hypothetical protein AA906_10390 [Geobacillus stearothermophilus]OAO80921.1 hypothetical protein TGS27_1817 [Geobacillus stearothermophilus]RLQ10820.1 hypothetical protein D9549_00015 [Geobacillus stearothermophilus]